MMLFSRLITLTGSPRRSLPWALEVTAYVNAHSDLQVSLWSANFGYPLGTLAWSAGVESQAALAAGTANLLADNGYFDLLEKGQDFITQPGQDLLRELVHGQPAGEPPAVGSVATITTAVANAARGAEAMAWGVDIAQYLTTSVGAPVSMFSNVYGTLGEITWIAVQPDLAAADTLRAKIGADAGYMGRLAGVGDLFVPASGHVSQAVRIA